MWVTGYIDLDGPEEETGAKKEKGRANIMTTEHLKARYWTQCQSRAKSMHVPHMLRAKAMAMYLHKKIPFFLYPKEFN